MSTRQPPDQKAPSSLPHAGDHVLNPREAALLVSAFLALGLSVLSVLITL
jgi:hypothetical protein